MAIIKQYHANTDTTYVYESVSYWDENKKQSRSNRKLLGKLDPATGEIVPTGKRGRPRKEPDEKTTDPAVEAAVISDARVKELAQMVAIRDARIEELEKENRKLRDMLSQLEENLNRCIDFCRTGRI